MPGGPEVARVQLIPRPPQARQRLSGPAAVTAPLAHRRPRADNCIYQADEDLTDGASATRRSPRLARIGGAADDRVRPEGLVRPRDLANNLAIDEP